MKIIERIFLILQEKNLKQTDLASAAGVSKSVVTSWKKRETDPPAAAIVKISELLGVSVRYLLTGIDDEGDYKSCDFVPSYNREETEILEVWRKLSYENKVIAKGELFRLAKSQVEETSLQGEYGKVAESSM